MLQLCGPLFPQNRKGGEEIQGAAKRDLVGGGVALEEDLDTDCLVKKAPAKEGDDERKKEMRQTESGN